MALIDTFDPIGFDPVGFFTGYPAPVGRVVFSNEAYNEGRTTRRNQPDYQKAGQLGGKYR